MTDDNRLKIGDVVIVPVGNNAEKKLKIKQIEYFTNDTLPMPLDK